MTRRRFRPERHPEMWSPPMIARMRVANWLIEEQGEGVEGEQRMYSFFGPGDDDEPSFVTYATREAIASFVRYAGRS